MDNANESERQHLTAKMLFLGQMASTETALFHQLAAAKHGLNITDSKTLSVLMQEGAMTAGQLAQRLCLTTGAVTSVIDRLEVLALVRRTSDDHDRRKVIIQPDMAKLKATGTTYQSIAVAFERQLSSYSLTQLRFLVDFYQTSIELTKQEIQNLSAQPDK